MKLLPRLLMALIMLMSCGITTYAAEIWVSPNGNDSNEGTRENPKLTLASALRQARELRRLNDASVKGGIQIHVEKGIYQLDEPVFIRPGDSGTADSPTTIIGDEHWETILSGGINITGWHKLTGNLTGLPAESKGRVWVADAPLTGNECLQFRQLWVNNMKTVRARDTEAPLMNRILSWDHKNQTLLDTHP